jgi:regulator of protease activity HflC (stomatin/prohibitin superfamily)
MSKGKIAIRTLAGLVVAGLVYTSLVITPFGHRSVIWSVGGVSYEERQPGLSFVFPLIQRYYKVDTREQRYATIDIDGKSNAFVQSSDLQEITVKGSVIYAIIPDQAAEIFDKIGPEYEKRIVEPIFFDAIKEASGKVQAEAYAGELGPLADAVKDIIAPQFEQRGIQVLSVTLEDAVFDPEFVLSVKEKVIADQEVAEQQKLVEAERAVAQQVELQAGAERARATALGLSPTEYLEWLYLQKWDGALPKTLLGDAASVILSGVE